MKILLAIDDSKFSEAATQMVAKQFRPDGTDVCVFHAVDSIGALPMSFCFGEGPRYEKDIDSWRDKLLREGEHLAARAAEQIRAAGFTVGTKIADGDPRHTILDYAREWQPDVIVMGSHGRGNLDRFLLGSVAETIARHTGCSVEIVRVPSPAAGRNVAKREETEERR